MRDMKDSGIEWIGEIPEDWEVAKLKNIKEDKKYSIVDGPFGTAINTNDYIDNGVPLIRITNLVNGKVEDKSMVYLSDEKASTLERSSISINDIIFAKTGATVGKCSINNKFKYGILSSSCIKISINKKLNTNYYYYFFTTNQFKQALINSCNGTTRDTINITPFSNLNTIIPSIEEQELIADYLDNKVKEIDNIILKTQETIEKYKKYKQSVITEVVTKGLNPNVEMKDSGIEWIDEIPKGWKKLKLKYISQLSPKCNTSRLKDDSIITFTPMEYIKNGYFINNTSTWKINNSSYSIYEEGDIAIAKVTPCFENGNISIMENLNNGIGLGSSELYILRCNEKVVSKYLLYYLQNSIFKNIGISTMTGTGGLKRVSSDLLKNHEIPLPPIEEQMYIVNFLDLKCTEVDKLITKKQELIAQLESYKKSLIYECVTGKKEVAVAYGY